MRDHIKTWLGSVLMIGVLGFVVLATNDFSSYFSDSARQTKRLSKPSIAPARNSGISPLHDSFGGSNTSGRPVVIDLSTGALTGLFLRFCPHGKDDDDGFAHRDDKGDYAFSRSYSTADGSPPSNIYGCNTYSQTALNDGVASFWSDGMIPVEHRPAPRPGSATSINTAYTYDELNRLTRVDYSDGQTVVYTYDSAGNRLSMNITGGDSPTPTPTATPTPTITPTPTPNPNPGPSVIQFATGTAIIDEGGGHIDVTVSRTGDVSGASIIDYKTVDRTGPGGGSQISDYEIALGTFSFGAGETSKTFRVLIVDDQLVEGSETVDLVLSNPTGTAVSLGTPSTVQLTIVDNDTVPSTTNPIDTASFFVRQQYLDFLNREPDTSGLNFWTNEITSCGANAQCTEVKRINVSAAFFLSIEFQNTGYLAYLTHRTAFGPTAAGSPVPVLYTNFMRDVQALQNGYAFGAPGAEPILEANKVGYFNEFVTRPEFVSKYPSTLTNQQYVDALLTSANLATTGSFRDNLISGLNGGTMTRATVLRVTADSTTIRSRELNNAFVTMEYFGYMRRNPDTVGFNFWLQKLNDFGGNYIAAEMVKAFIVSTEYRQRFGSGTGPFQSFSKAILDAAYNGERRHSATAPQRMRRYPLHP